MITRREFLKAAGATAAAAAAGLLAGCRPQESPVPPTAATLATRPVPPGELGTVVHTHHAGVWAGETLVPEVLGQMLDASITTLTGLESADTAWATLFDPGERIAIKVNSIRGSDYWTHVPLVLAVTERLQQIGVPAEQIIIYDRRAAELRNAGFPVNQDEPGVRCYGTEGDYVEGWQIMDSPIRLSAILLSCDALINMPLLKRHGEAGISFALKNHFGTFDRPSRFHQEERLIQGLAELNALPPIRERTRLIIGDALVFVARDWSRAWMGNAILMSFDPVAHDAVGLHLMSEAMTAEGAESPWMQYITRAWLESGQDVGLGTSDLDEINLLEVNLG